MLLIARGFEQEHEQEHRRKENFNLQFPPGRMKMSARLRQGYSESVREQGGVAGPPLKTGANL
jgi:hypothetical protein